MNNNLILNNSNTSLIEPQSYSAINFLRDSGLPIDNIIASSDERKIIENNLPNYINNLPSDVKQDARYLSKFVIGAATGLFDYSLNSIWNEIVLALRKKAITYGLDIFFDSATNDKTREFFSTEDDLALLKDAVLLDTCKKLELISSTTFTKLKYILDMRNNIGISHPTNYVINGFELLSWLAICIDILKDKPTEEALRVQVFIANVKKCIAPLNDEALKLIKNQLETLQTHHLANILRTLFSIYVSDDTNVEVRKNIANLAPIVWNSCLDEPKYNLGIILEGYNNNLQQNKYELGKQFFELVKGNSFKSTNERTIIIDSLLNQLLEKHNEWDNFHNEAPIAFSLISYIQKHSDIIKNNAEKLAFTILNCRIGNGVDYCNGVSQRAKPCYDHILSQLSDEYAPYAIVALTNYNIKSKLEKTNCKKEAKEALKIIKSNITQPRLIECFDYLIERIETNSSCFLDKEFKIKSANYINWS